MSPDIKVTDKRIFREDGELREEYRYLDEEKAGPSAAEAEPPPAGAPPEETAGRGLEPETTAGTASRPGQPTSLPPPRFFDLVGILAEPVPLYLGDAAAPDGRSLENLPVARFHIDLLDVLLKKTEGNLDEAERAVLEDVIYRLRLRYVEKTR